MLLVVLVLLMVLLAVIDFWLLRRLSASVGTLGRRD